MISTIVAGLFAIVAVRFVWRFVEQYETNRYFKKVSPNLPVVESPSLVSGHSSILVSERNVAKIHKLHEKHGKNYGIYHGKQPIVATCDLKLIEKVLVGGAKLNINRMRTQMPTSELEFDSIATADDEQWRRIRRAFAPGLAPHKISSSQNLLEDVNVTIKELFECIEWRRKNQAEGGELVTDVADLILRSRVQLVFRSFFKQDSLIDFKAEKDFYTTTLEEFADSLANRFVIWAVMYPSVRFLMQWFSRRFMSVGFFFERCLMTFLRNQIELNTKASHEIDLARKKTEQEGRFFDDENFTLKDGTKFKRKLLDPIIENFRARQITYSEFMNSMLFLFFAAYRTSSDTETYLLYQLALNPKIQDKLRESLLKDGEDSQYLDWCMKESLRLFPTVPMGPSRMLEEDYETEDGIVIKKGVYIFVSIYTIQRMKELWGEDVEEFNPDRWARSKEFHPLQYLPFGHGVRMCPGKFFSNFTSKKILTALLTRYKFSVTDRTIKDFQYSSPLLITQSLEDPIHLKVSPV